jgi:hypothetical protein
MGGELEIIAKFPDGNVKVDKFEGLEAKLWPVPCLLSLCLFVYNAALLVLITRSVFGATACNSSLSFSTVGVEVPRSYRA